MTSSEFEMIDRLLAPLSAGRREALGLSDDAALLSCPEGKELVVTTDSLQEGIHFIGNEPPGRIAQKLLRVNLSDLAAKGAVPYCYFLNLGLPRHRGGNWLRGFVQGLAQDQARYGLFLAGGDTTNTKAHLSLSLTVCGYVEKGRMIRRNGAGEGEFYLYFRQDWRCVSGIAGSAGRDISRCRYSLSDAVIPVARPHR